MSAHVLLNLVHNLLRQIAFSGTNFANALRSLTAILDKIIMLQIV